jgi:hypothetical protein
MFRTYLARFFPLLILLCCSCGYKLSSYPPALSLDFIEKDHDGMLIAEITKQLANKGIKYNDKSDLKLIVKITGKTTNDIGYMHDREENGKPKKNILPSEAREKISAEVMIKNISSDKIILGPLLVNASCDFDFIQQDVKRELVFTDINNIPQETLKFSLGQLEAKESAEQAAQRPLYQNLAKNIVDVIMAYL